MSEEFPFFNTDPHLEDIYQTTPIRVTRETIEFTAPVNPESIHHLYNELVPEEYQAEIPAGIDYTQPIDWLAEVARGPFPPAPIDNLNYQGRMAFFTIADTVRKWQQFQHSQGGELEFPDTTLLARRSATMLLTDPEGYGTPVRCPKCDTVYLIIVENPPRWDLVGGEFGACIECFIKMYDPEKAAITAGVGEGGEAQNVQGEEAASDST
jgi:hypothetical protein